MAIFRNWEKISELIHYTKQLRKYGIKPEFGKAVVEFSNGAATVAKVQSDFKLSDNEIKRVACDVVAVGWGFQPDRIARWNIGLCAKS
jgi:NADPH-dependent 2,4-dienoyl-CoA reductase/sulfur reductase-like enzyme